MKAVGEQPVGVRKAADLFAHDRPVDAFQAFNDAYRAYVSGTIVAMTALRETLMDEDVPAADVGFLDAVIRLGRDIGERAPTWWLPAAA